MVQISNDGIPFSFSRVNNRAVALSAAEYLLFLNNDTEVLEARWLSRLVGYAQLPGVGVTGARLLYPDATTQHAGVILDLNVTACSAPDHAFRNQPQDQLSYFFFAETARECCAVTGACLLTPRKLFLEVGGFREDPYSVSLSDVDYCLRLADRGLRSIYVADSILVHYETRSRDREDDPRELAAFRQTYGKKRDPYYNVNLSRQHPFTVSPECKLDYLAFLDRPLDVACFTHNLNPEGGPKVVAGAAIALKARQHLRPIVMSFQDGPAKSELDSEGVPCQILPLKGTKNVLGGWHSLADYEQSVNSVREVLECQRPAVVLAMTLHNFHVVDAAARASIPTLWLIQESYDTQRLEGIVAPWLQETCTNSFRRAAWVVFGSRETQSLYERYNWKNNFTVVYNSLRAEKIDGIAGALGKDAARHSLGIPAGKKVMLSVGTICPRKDQVALVRAVELLARTRNDFCLYLVGARENDPYVRSYLRSIRHLIDRFELGNIVYLVEETPDTSSYYLAADIFVFGSFIESFSFVILEAMAHGLPIITTPCCGVGEQIRVGVNALLFDFSDVNTCAAHLNDLLNDSNRREEMGRNSKNIFRYMQTFDEMAERYEQLVVAAWLNGADEQRWDVNGTRTSFTHADRGSSNEADWTESLGVKSLGFTSSSGDERGSKI